MNILQYYELLATDSCKTLTTHEAPDDTTKGTAPGYTSSLQVPGDTILPDPDESPPDYTGVLQWSPHQSCATRNARPLKIFDKERVPHLVGPDGRDGEAELRQGNKDGSSIKRNELQ